LKAKERGKGLEKVNGPGLSKCSWWFFSVRTFNFVAIVFADGWVVIVDCLGRLAVAVVVRGGDVVVRALAGCAWVLERIRAERV
jgi:hypothetical protein